MYVYIKKMDFFFFHISEREAVHSCSLQYHCIPCGGSVFSFKHEKHSDEECVTFLMKGSVIWHEISVTYCQ